MNSADRLKVAVLISGSGTNLQAIIDADSAGELSIDIVAVISDRPSAYGLERAARANIPTVALDYRSFAKRSDYDEQLDNKLGALNPDLIVLAGYMRILPANTVERFQGRMLNVHPSLLPAYPGLHTHERVLAAGDKFHGSTVHFVTPELDAGPAVVQYRISVRPGEMEPELRERVQSGEYIIYPLAISWFAARKLRFENGQVYKNGKLLTQPEIVDEKS